MFIHNYTDLDIISTNLHTGEYKKILKLYMLKANIYHLAIHLIQTFRTKYQY